MPEPFRLTALRYSYVEEMLESRKPHRDAHLALVGEYTAAGRLLIAGALGDPPTGAFFAFCDDTAAGDFVAADPTWQRAWSSHT